MARWSKDKLVNLTTKIGSGATPKGGKAAYKVEGISLIRSMNVHDNYFKPKDLAFIDEQQADKLSNVVVEKLDVLLNITGASVARCSVVNESYLPARVNQHVAILRPKSEVIDSHFLSYLLVSHEYKKKLLHSGNKAGSTREALTKSQLQNFEIEFPELPEQKRIVAILDQAFAEIEQARALAEKNLNNARELFESYLQQVFSQRGEGWVEADIESLVSNGILDKPLDGNHGDIHPKKADFVEKGVPFIMASDLVDGTVDTGGCNFITRQQADTLRKGFAKDGDVLISHKATIGRTAILKTDLDYVMLTPQVTYYRILDGSSLAAEYLYWYFNSPVFLKEMRIVAGVGSTRSYIGITKQRQLQISFPDIDIQRKISQKLCSLDKEIKRIVPVYERKLAALDELKKSILQQAFTGQLTTSKEVA
ncbi:restriction endonuclease subunit S [Endozoicomonas numazuensis]|uniref:restriction endonuclease subunit S n=1 Tax=Endozoicomonas numazuensis TaxID=1137799 RepID=UPI000689ACCC|nr:restriction endonuclease subunit S [Endozoicomonas numazuensis]